MFARATAAVLAAFAVFTVTATADAKRRFFPPSAEVRAAICAAFGPYCHQAIGVAWCESEYHPWARNGQYLGVWQMGSWERRTYGHGSTVREQARAAYRYFVASGRDWSPWSCAWARHLA